MTLAPQPPDVRWQRARRILCVRPGALGAVLLCTPAMRALRTALPGATLTLLGSPAGAAALPFIPELDAAIACMLPWMVDAAPQPRAAGLALVETLAAHAFDAAVIFTSVTQSPLPAARLCQLAGIPLRLAHGGAHPHGLLSDWVPDTDTEPTLPVRHEVVRQLALVRHLGLEAGRRQHAGASSLSFRLRPADVAALRARLHEAGIAPDAPWLLLHPGAGAAARRYPPGHWAQVLRLLRREVALPIVLTGSAEEIALVETIRAEAGVTTVSLAGRLTLGELGAALHLAAVALTNNTGPAHIAAAVGTPVVVLYALTHPQQTPWNTRSRVLFHDVPCRFCCARRCPAEHLACLAGVAPARVVDAVRALLETTAVRLEAAAADSA